jgi:hypothetical protein
MVGLIIMITSEVNGDAVAARFASLLRVGEWRPKARFINFAHASPGVPIRLIEAGTPRARGSLGTHAERSTLS